MHANSKAAYKAILTQRENKTLFIATQPANPLTFPQSVLLKGALIKGAVLTKEFCLKSVSGKAGFGDTARSSQQIANIACLTTICLIVATMFYKTIFFAKPISKVFAISSMDSLYRPEVKTVQVTSPVDPCIYFFQIPASVAIERIWKQGQIPLWNPDNACGHPIMANIESCVFSWHQFLFSTSSERMYNLGIVARILVAAVGAFFFTRSFQISPLFSALAALTYALCPNLMRGAELTTETWSYPWLLYLFRSCNSRISISKLLSLATGCALICATIHPECSFNIITIGCGLLLLQRCLDAPDTRWVSRLQIFTKTTGWLLIVGIFTFCFAAPVLLPFIEFMVNSDCHKFQNIAPPVVPLAAFLLTLAHPTMAGSSPFLGVLCLPATAVAIFRPRREVITLIIGTVITVAFASLVGPLSPLFSHRPLNLLEPHYLQPICMLFLACLMAEGFEKLSRKDGNGDLAIFVATLAIVLALPPLLQQLQTPISALSWDMEKISIYSNLWKTDVVIGLLSCLAITFTSIKKRYTLTACALVLASLASQLTISRMSLPTHPSFNYAALGPIPWLKQHSGRFIAMGRHFIVPNINMIWEISDFRNHNSLYIARYLDFQSVCGGRRYFATDYRYEDSLPNLINAASVKYVVSRSPVYSTTDLLKLPQSLRSIAKLEQDVEVSSTQVVFDTSSNQALCLLKWHCPEAVRKSQKIQFATLDGDNKEIWSSNEFPLTIGDDNNPKFSQTGRWFLPEALPTDKPLKLVLRLNNLWSNQPLWPKSAVNTIRNNVVVATINAKEFEAKAVEDAVDERRFKLVAKTEDGTRIFENKHALPEAYTLPVQSAQLAKDGADALQRISSKSFNARKLVILEQAKQAGIADSAIQASQVGQEEMTPAILKRSNANQVEIVTDCSTPAYLILTDTFYPGWKAYLSGSNVQLEIYRANFLFRAVKVPQGKSTITFRYEPDSLNIGYLLLGSGLLGATLLVAQSKWPRAKQ